MGVYECNCGGCVVVMFDVFVSMDSYFYHVSVDFGYVFGYLCFRDDFYYLNRFWKKRIFFFKILVAIKDRY